MAPEDRDVASLTVFEFFSLLIGDDDAAAAREDYLEVVASSLAGVASWLGFDAALGAGDVKDTRSPSRGESDPVRQRAFVACGLVAQISSELVSGARALFDSGNEYGASALVRQLIECEYLLRAFRLNFSDAAKWLETNDSERWDFKPSRLREIGGFDRREYANHCEAGGHPHPAGRQLLELPRAVDRLTHAVSGDTRDLDVSRVLRLDFAFHCDRVWRALVELLSGEHARFDRVRKEAVAAVANSRIEWQQSDTLAQHAGWVLAALEADPTTLLGELMDRDT